MQVELVLAIVAACILLLSWAGVYIIHLQKNFRDSNNRLAESIKTIDRLSGELASERNHSSALGNELKCKIFILESELSKEKAISEKRRDQIELLKSEISNNAEQFVAFAESAKAHSEAQAEILSLRSQLVEKDIASNNIAAAFHEAQNASQKKDKEIAILNDKLSALNNLNSDTERLEEENYRLKYDNERLRKKNGSLRIELDNARKNREVVIRYEKGIDPIVVAAKDKEISRLNNIIVDLNSEICYFRNLSKSDNANLLRGYAYELQVGKRYEYLNYFVFYSGIVLGTKDQGVDLVAVSSDGAEVLIIQCKNYQANSVMDYRHIKSFINAASAYTTEPFIKSVKPVLVCTPSTYFDQQASMALSEIEKYEIEFDYSYQQNIYNALENIRIAQTKFYFNEKNLNIFRVTLFHKINELRNSKKE